MWLSKLAIVHKSILSVAVIGFGLVILAAISLTSLWSLRDTMDDVAATGVVATLAARMNTNIQVMSALEATMAVDLSPETVRNTKIGLEAEHALFMTRAALAYQTVSDSSCRSLLVALSQKEGEFMTSAYEMIAQADIISNTNVHDHSSLVYSVRIGRAHANEMRELVRTFFSCVEKIADVVAAQGREIARKRSLHMTVLSVITLVVGIGLALLVAVAGVVRPLSVSVRCVETLARGRLEDPVIGTDRRDEIGDVARSLEVLRTKLQRERDLHHQIETILASAGEGISGIDREGYITFINQFGAKMLGWSVGELIGQHQHSLIHYLRHDGTPYSISDCPIYAAMEDKVPKHVTGEVFLHRDGHPFSVEYTSMPIEVEGKVTGAVVVFRDISLRLAHENEMELARRIAENSNFAKSRFLATMSHELRTPLHAILGFSEILLDPERSPPLDPSCAEYLRDIHVSASHLHDVINDILDISKIEAGKLQVEPSWLSTSEMVNRVRRLLAERAHTSRLSLKTIVPDNVPDIYADERALKQILFNLLSNAIKFTLPGGTVTLEVMAVCDGIDIRVSDTGIGIPADQIPRILKPFEQMDNRYCRSMGGTGLGLAVVQGLIGLHGGSLLIQSEPGKGSSFTVHFPANLQPAPNA